jgi:hypothetical protein
VISMAYPHKKEDFEWLLNVDKGDKGTSGTGQVPNIKEVGIQPRGYASHSDSSKASLRVLDCRYLSKFSHFTAQAFPLEAPEPTASSEKSDPTKQKEKKKAEVSAPAEGENGDDSKESTVSKGKKRKETDDQAPSDAIEAPKKPVLKELVFRGPTHPPRLRPKMLMEVPAGLTSALDSSLSTGGKFHSYLLSCSLCSSR